MKNIEISEAAFVQANSYYLLKWGLVILVSITIIYEQRSIYLQIKESERVIEVYEDLLSTAENARFALSEIILGGPTPSEPISSLIALRANGIKLRSLTNELKQLVEKRTDLSVKELGETNAALLRLLSLLYYNDMDPDQAPPPVDGEAALRLVDYRLGSFSEVRASGT